MKCLYVQIDFFNENKCFTNRHNVGESYFSKQPSIPYSFGWWSDSTLTVSTNGVERELNDCSNFGYRPGQILTVSVVQGSIYIPHYIFYTVCVSKNI